MSLENAQLAALEMLPGYIELPLNAIIDLVEGVSSVITALKGGIKKA